MTENVILKSKKNLNTKNKIQPIFARHETFHPRFGWLKKGFDKIKNYPELFAQEEAPVILGVGKNMVKAIKYWCIAYKVLEENYEKENKTKVISTTEFGEKLLGENGWDPYLEDLGSLWLLHWNLIKYPCYAPAWYFTFNEFHKNEFTLEELLSLLKTYKETEFPSSNSVESSLKKDINCIIRMYCNQEYPKSLVEDSIDSPFIELSLIQSLDSRYFSFNFGDKVGLEADIIIAICLDYISLIQENNSKTISISSLFSHDCIMSPAKIFKLTQSSLISAIERVAENFSEISLSDDSGLIQLSFDGDPEKLSIKILENYYNKRK